MLVVGLLAAQAAHTETTPARAFELTSQLSIGGGARFGEPPALTSGLFTMALRADVLFGRSAPRTFGVGPYLSVRTDNFADLAPSVGVSLLLPVHEALPLVLSAGGAMRWDRAGLAFGGLQRLWWGARSYNYNTPYTLSVGIFVEAREFADPSRTVDLVAGVDVDLQALAIPFIGLYTWIFRRDPGR